jgi:membrane protease YdiL (CAAX protease family)
MWLKKPPRPHKAHLWHIAAIIVIATYANIISNLVLDPVWHIPFQLGILGISMLIATRAGTTWTSMGLRKDRAKRGFIVGGVIIGLITIGFVVAIAAAAVFPDVRPIFDNTEVIENSTGFVLFQAFVRIPLATAFYEEVLFRGVIFGMLTRRHSPLLAAVITSLLFGLWHIAPTIADPPNAQLDPNGLLDIAKLAVFAVVGTAPAGLAFRRTCVPVGPSLRQQRLGLRARPHWHQQRRHPGRPVRSELSLRAQNTEQRAQTPTRPRWW